MSTDLEFFETLVRDYVALIDACIATPSRDISATTLVAHLRRLTAGAAELRNSANSNWPDLPSREHWEYLECYKALHARLPFTLYWTCLGPTELTEEPEFGTGDLADDLADIYFDLCEGLQLLDAGFSEGALFTWRLSFWSHWGAHASNAVAAMVDYEQRKYLERPE